MGDIVNNYALQSSLDSNIQNVNVKWKLKSTFHAFDFLVGTAPENMMDVADRSLLVMDKDKMWQPTKNKTYSKDEIYKMAYDIGRSGITKFKKVEDPEHVTDRNWGGEPPAHED